MPFSEGSSTVRLRFLPEYAVGRDSWSLGVFFVSVSPPLVLRGLGWWLPNYEGNALLLMY